MRVASGIRLVAAAWRQRAPVHDGVCAHSLHRVVGVSEELLVRAGGDVLAVRPELRQPEAVDVRLVADDEVIEAGEAPAMSATNAANWARVSALVGVTLEPVG